MSLYGTREIASIDTLASSDRMLEMFIVDDVIRGTQEQIKEFCESEEAKVLVEANVLRKPTMMRLSKADDEKRRTKIAAYELAREANDPLWTKLVKHQKMKKMYAEKILNKYGTKAEKVAKTTQKKYIKTAARGKKTADEKK